MNQSAEPAGSCSGQCPTHAEIVSLQRGDVVDVSLNDGAFTYRGVVLSATRRCVYVITRASGISYRSGYKSATMKLVERHGRKRFNALWAMAQEFA